MQNNQDLANDASKRFKYWHLTIALLIFLTDHPQFSAASLFETTISTQKEKVKKFRLPASASPQVVKYDCKQPQEQIEFSTTLETVRVEAVNCDEDIGLKNMDFNISLHTFPTLNKTFSSEFAYLTKGTNRFQITTGKHAISLNIHRFD